MKEARAQIGLDGKLLDGHLAIKKYFNEHVGMDRYKLATRFFENMVEIHGAVVEGDQKRALGRIATIIVFRILFYQWCDKAATGSRRLSVHRAIHGGPGR